MKRVQITQRYTDMELNRKVQAGEVLEVSDARAEQLLGVNVATVIEVMSDDSAEKPAKKEKPKTTKDLNKPLKTPEGVEENKTPEVPETPESNEGSEEGSEGSEPEQTEGSQEGAEQPEAPEKSEVKAPAKKKDLQPTTPSKKSNKKAK